MVLIADFGGLNRPLLWRPPAESINYYFDPYPPDEILPTPLPNEWSCWGCCCLFPAVGGVIGYKVPKEKSAEAKQKGFNFGLNYSLGSAWTGTCYSGPEMFYVPNKMLYWVNRLDIEIGYALESTWALSTGFGYVWGRERDRVSAFDYQGQHGSLTSAAWEISAFVPILTINFLRKNKKFLKVGIEFYLAKANIYERKAYTTETVTIFAKGFCPGGFIGVGSNLTITPFLELEYSIIGRLAFISNPCYWSKEKGIVRTRSFLLNFSGFYLKLGLDYYFWKGG